MSVVDIDSLLDEISDDSPCGEDLEYDGEFTAMERAAQGKAEQQIGDTVVDAEEPDWREVQSKAVELFSRTKDLRVGVQLTQALMNREGFVGLSDGLAVTKGLIDRYWDGVHPQLDPDDDNDPTQRVNILVSLCDPSSTLKKVRELPLVSSRTLGRFSLRDIEVASGEAPAAESDESPPEMSVIDAAFMDCDLEELQATAEAIRQAVEHVSAIDSLVTERVGAVQAPDFGDLATTLKGPHAILVDRLARRGVGVEAPEGMDEDGAGAAAPQAIIGEITSREDVVRMLDKVCDYLERHEPSSPVPLLLRRAKRLTSKSFMEIVRDMAPDGVSQVEVVTGVGEESED